eukprot:6209327-Karenia_brevis.AAC.1
MRAALQTRDVQTFLAFPGTAGGTRGRGELETLTPAGSASSRGRGGPPNTEQLKCLYIQMLRAWLQPQGLKRFLLLREQLAERAGVDISNYLAPRVQPAVLAERA